MLEEGLKVKVMMVSGGHLWFMCNRAYDASWAIHEH